MVDVELPIESVQPSLSVAQLTFSDGTVVDLDEHDVVIIVGPNNSGKSAALKQIERLIGKKSKYNVVTDCKVRQRGNNEDFENYVKSVSHKIWQYIDYQYVGYKYDLSASNFSEYKGNLSDKVRDFFVLRCSTDNRLSGSNHVKSIAPYKEQPSHPIHLLVTDRSKEKVISEKFFQAFSQNLYVDRAGGSEVSLYVGPSVDNNTLQDPFSSESINFFRNQSVSLENQGDGMRAFATLALNTLAISQQTVILIDEPEAFLHPPQARLLGGMLVPNDIGPRQTFIATHSSDILKGILENNKRVVHLLRMSRSGDVNHVHRMDPKFTRELMNDPLIRYSGIFDSIFYKHVILCESETDCQFYAAMLGLEEVSGPINPDVLFVQSSGKHRLTKLAVIAKKLNVPFSIVVDVDVLREKTLFKNLVEVVGLSWNEIEKAWKELTSAIEAQKTLLTPGQIISSIEESLGRLRRKETSLGQFLIEIKDAIRTNSPWESVKRAGRSGMPMGEIVKLFDNIVDKCGKNGLWILPVGELEGFCRSVGGFKGSAWIAKVFEENNLQTSPELAEARFFASKIWKNLEAG